MLIFLVNGDSTAVDTVITYEIPEVVEPFGEIYPVGEITVRYHEQTALDILMNLPIAPVSYGYGMLSAVMNKGRKPSYTHVSVNGHSLNTHPFGNFNLGLLSLHFFDRLSFGQTTAGAEFSSMNFMSKINRYERPYSLVHFMFGSFESNTYGFDLTRGITNDLGFYLSGSYHKTNGHRENADAQILSVYTNIYVDYFIPLRFDILYANDDYGFPGSTSVPVEGRQKDEFLDVSGTTKLGNEMLTLFYERQTMDYRDTVYDRTWGVQVDHFGARSEGSDTLLGVVLDYGASTFFTLMEGETYLPTISNGLDVWVRLVKSFGRGFVRAAGKLERASYHDIFLFPRIELGVKALRSAAVYAAFSRDARSPSDMETSAPFDTLNPYLAIAGNEFMNPEYCWCGEVGFRSDEFILNAYRLMFTDYITVLSDSPNYYRYGNVDKWEMNGFEGYVNLPMRSYNADSSTLNEFVVGLSGNMILSGDTVVYFPRLGVGAVAAFRRETPRFGFGIVLRAEYSNERYDISGAEYSGYSVFSAAGLVKFMGLSCVLRLNNIFDEEYAYLPFYPMAPRNFDVSVKWEFWD
ncbi:MAG: TonB-dependent receptor [candidate division WOR-3 bacterium]|nr:TonB-dependent receptor [candidate division WOR-3 bacterium]